MNEPADSLSPEGEWYFSRDGQQSGPLSYDELKAKADEGALMPRKDLVWKEGMTDWRPVGEIEGLFERRPPAVTEDDTPYSTPTGGYEETGNTGEWPGARRRGYLFGIFIFPILWHIVMTIVTVQAQEFLGKPLPPLALLLLPFVPVIVSLYYTFQRFPNLGMSRFWFLGNFVPILNIWLGYRCFACPAGYAQHKKMDGIGIFLAIIYWLFLLIVIAAIAIIGYLAYKTASDPNFQNPLRESFGPAFDKFQEQLKAQK